MNKIEYALKLAKDCTYADEMTEGAKEFLRKAIDEALTEVLPQADVCLSKTKEAVAYGDYVQLDDRFESVHIWSKEVEMKCNRHRYEGSVPWTPKKITKEEYNREKKHSWNN